MGEISIDNADPNSMTLTPDEANQAYGVGDLKFDEPIKETTAATLSERKKSEMDRQYFLANGSSGGRFLPGMAAGMVGGMANPVDLALAFVPFVGEEAMAAKLGKAGAGPLRQAFARGLITREAIQATGIPAPVLASHVLQGTLNQSLFEIPNLMASAQDHADYGPSDAIRNIIGGGIFAGAIHAAGGVLRRLTPDTHLAMMNEAMNQFLKDEDIRVDKYVALDEESIRDKVRFDESSVRQRALDSVSDEQIKQEIFKTFHEQPKQAAVMLTDEGGNSTIYNGSFHGDAWGKVPKEDLDKVSTGQMSATEGFTTDTGRFIGRDEAGQLMGLHEHLTSEAMHGTTDESFLSEHENDLFHHLQEQGKSKSDAWNDVMKERYENQRKFFFDRPDIQQRIEQERQRQVDAFMEKERANYDPKSEFTKEAQKEIQKQQAQGKLLTQEQIDKYLPADKNFTDMSAEMMSKDVQNLKENLGVKTEEQIPKQTKGAKQIHNELVPGEHDVSQEERMKQYGPEYESMIKERDALLEKYHYRLKDMSISDKARYEKLNEKVLPYYEVKNNLSRQEHIDDEIAKLLEAPGDFKILNEKGKAASSWEDMDMEKTFNAAKERINRIVTGIEAGLPTGSLKGFVREGLTPPERHANSPISIPENFDEMIQNSFDKWTSEHEGIPAGAEGIIKRQIELNADLLAKAEQAKIDATKGLSPDEQAHLGSVPKPQGDAIDAALNCITKKMI
jgi:hypothetical protein